MRALPDMTLEQRVDDRMLDVRSNEAEMRNPLTTKKIGTPGKASTIGHQAGFAIPRWVTPWARTT